MRTAAALLALLAALLAPGCGGEEATPSPEPSSPPAGTVPSPAPPDERARAAGLYLHRTSLVEVRLELAADGAFRLRSEALETGEVRTSRGTWHLEGTRLTLEHTHLGEDPVADGPQRVVNYYDGRDVRLEVPGSRDWVRLRRQQRLILGPGDELGAPPR